MATVGSVDGNIVGIFNGATLIGCATSASMDLSTSMTDATCKDGGGQEQVKPSQKTWGMSMDGILAFDTTPEEGWTELMSAWTASTLLTLKFGTGVTGDPSYIGDAYIESLSASAPLNEMTTYSVSFKGTGTLATGVEA